jgi:hypothetical protein
MTSFDISHFPEFRQIPLSKGYYATVDAENYAWLMQWKWCAQVRDHRVYAVRNVYLKGRYKQVQMHRLIMVAPSGMQVDHKNGDGTMNVYDNLRICTHAQNHRNFRPMVGWSSKYKGVSRHKKSNKWRARIMLDGKEIYLGEHESEEEAALAYNEAAKLYHGEFARLNIILASTDEGDYLRDLAEQQEILGAMRGE